MSSFIRLDNVHKTYRLGETLVPALRGATLDLRRGEFTALVGPSGSGKSTLLNMVGCIDEPDQGAVLVEGRDVSHLSDDDAQPAAQREDRVHLPVVQPRARARHLRERRAAAADQRADPGRRSGATACMQAIRDVELEDFVRHAPDKLSGGQRQRVAIARALVTSPLLVLADEPTANLDSATAHRIIDLLHALNAQRGVTFFFSTHDEKLMSRVARVVHILDGVIERDSRRRSQRMSGSWRVAWRSLRATGAATSPRRSRCCSATPAWCCSAATSCASSASCAQLGLPRAQRARRRLPRGRPRSDRPRGPARYSLTPAQQQVIAGVLGADPRVEFFGRYLRGQGLAGNGCRTVPFRRDGRRAGGRGARPGASRRAAAHAADFVRPLQGPPRVARRRTCPGAVGLSAGLARLLRQAEGPRRGRRRTATSSCPSAGRRTAAAQIASDANVQLAGDDLRRLARRRGRRGRQRLPHAEHRHRGPDHRRVAGRCCSSSTPPTTSRSSRRSCTIAGEAERGGGRPARAARRRAACRQRVTRTTTTT